MQAPNRISRDLLMEGQTKHTWRTANPWDQLLGHLHPSSCMACNLFLLYFIHNTTLENLAIGFCHGLSTGTHTNPALYEYTKRIQDSQGSKQSSHGPQTNTQHIWTKTRAKSMGSLSSPRTQKSVLQAKSS